MIQIEDVVVSFDVLREKFLCNLDACKGECCIEGDAGAPVELEEVETASLLAMTRKDAVIVPLKRLIGMARLTFINRYHVTFIPSGLGITGHIKQ